MLDLWKGCASCTFWGIAHGKDFRLYPAWTPSRTSLNLDSYRRSASCSLGTKKDVAEWTRELNNKKICAYDPTNNISLQLERSCIRSDLVTFFINFCFNLTGSKIFSNRKLQRSALHPAWSCAFGLSRSLSVLPSVVESCKMSSISIVISRISKDL